MKIGDKIKVEFDGSFQGEAAEWVKITAFNATVVAWVPRRCITSLEDNIEPANS